ncbi:hypothetical protein D039_4746A, partial [Vibrio parahaemolyticus EKP-028]
MRALSTVNKRVTILDMVSALQAK